VSNRPLIAAESGDKSPRRSLILAGGGMRVAYQAGVIRALADHGLRFQHVDGTSGGIFNLAMLLSGIEPAEMCSRWRTLPVRDFMSFLPLREYLRSPHLPALGGAEGMVDKVFPHLGIDVAKIREVEGLEGTVNVCNYTRKVNEVIGHRDIDTEFLVAGVSLPIFLPAVQRGEILYLDSVWIRDANIMEAVRRGADELWLVWCIGNTSEYKNGPFNQYVHMIEIAANGRLFEDFDLVQAVNAERIAAGRVPIRLHVIKPRYPLPLDPEYYLGEITGEELVAMGYRDAADYINGATSEGVELTPEATHMELAPPGKRFLEVMTGPGWTPSTGGERTVEKDGGIELRLVVETYESREQTPQARLGRVCGAVSLPGMGTDVPLDGGDIVRSPEVSDPAVEVRYSSRLSYGGDHYWLEVARRRDAARGRCRLEASLYPAAAGATVRSTGLAEDVGDELRAMTALGLAKPATLFGRLRARMGGWLDRLPWRQRGR
jgi:predicted acylesterase/phospholipase RssA